MTVLEVIQRSTDFLAKRDVESPRLQTELLLAHLLKLPRMQLYLNFERNLNDGELAEFREMILRRGKREPLQYIVGSTSFCGIEIALSPKTLIPRPETELLAEHAWQFLSQSPDSEKTLTALDFGTGTGCIAIALAVKAPVAHVYGIDISSDAIRLASNNAASCGVSSRITFLQSNSLAALPQELSFNLIASNPPYIPTPDLEKLQPEVKDYEPRTALDGGPDGLNFFRQLAVEAKPLLKSHGSLMLEFGDEQEESVRQILEAEKWIVAAIEQDYNRRPRFIIAKRPASDT